MSFLTAPLPSRLPSRLRRPGQFRGRVRATSAGAATELLEDRVLSAAAGLGAAALLPPPPWSDGRESVRAALETSLAELLSSPSVAAAELQGTWELVYTSRGTAVTRALPQLPLSLPQPTVSGVLQSLAAEGAGYTTTNVATVGLGLLGTWSLRAAGTWTPLGQGVPTPDARVAFNAFSFELVDQQILQPLTLQVPEVLRQAATFRTLWLGGKLRVAEGAASGNRFVFRRV